MSNHRPATCNALILVGALLVVASPASAVPGMAKVWIVDESPLVVRGSGFHSDSQVSVVVSKTKHIYKKTSTSTAAGSFTARFTPDLSRACGTTIISARDASGVLAISKTVMNDCGGMRVPPPR
jgi:hypothetical protein